MDNVLKTKVCYKKCKWEKAPALIITDMEKNTLVSSFVEK